MAVNLSPAAIGHIRAAANDIVVRGSCISTADPHWPNALTWASSEFRLRLGRPVSYLVVNEMPLAPPGFPTFDAFCERILGLFVVLHSGLDKGTGVLLTGTLDGLGSDQGLVLKVGFEQPPVVVQATNWDLGPFDD